MVLKLSPDATAARRQADLLVHWSGAGAVELRAADPDDGALLMERVTPGTTLDAAGLSPTGQARALCRVIEAFRSAERPAPELPPMEAWVARLANAASEDSGGIFSEAHTRATELLNASDSRAALHGDLHHANLLREGSGWAAVDPAGVLGPPEAEPAAFLRNPRHALLSLPRPDAVDVSLERTRAVCRALDYDPGAVTTWSWVLCVLAAAWALDDERGRAEVNCWLSCARILRRVREEVVDGG